MGSVAANTTRLADKVRQKAFTATKESRSLGFSPTVGTFGGESKITSTLPSHSFLQVNLAVFLLPN